jgi:sialate O-acetylesterase
VACVPAAADVKLPGVFGDHMVLQRGLAVPVWGWAEPGEEVTVRFAGQEKEATTDGLGKWTVRLEPVEANNEGRSLEIVGSNKVVLRDVLVGDVWVCSGQSNMEWPVSASMNAQQEIAAAKFPAIRLFDVRGHITAPLPQTDAPGNWQVCSPETVPGFSAVGFYFGRHLHRESGVPVGLIGTNWGGTRIEPWTPPVGFRSVPELRSLAAEVNRFDPTVPEGKKTWESYFQNVEDWAGRSRAALRAGAPLPAPIPRPGFTSGGQPTAIYHAMVHPLAPYGIRGAIWYQGESNGGEGIEYFHKMQALIGGWRQVWNQGEFPIYFYFVQLANWQQPNDEPAGGDGWARVREAQRQALTIPHTGMAVTTDIGEAGDIHPRNKQDVGVRLARWALRDVHGKQMVVSGPLYREMKVEGKAIRVSFDHVGGGLIVGQKQGLAPTQEVDGGKLKRFAIAGEDRQWHWADAQIDGDTVVVSCGDVPKPVAVRYAYSMNPEGANLYNQEGLPAAPFRTDNW